MPPCHLCNQEFLFKGSDRFFCRTRDYPPPTLCNNCKNNDGQGGGNNDGKDASAQLKEGGSAPGDEEGKEDQGQDKESQSAVAALISTKPAPHKKPKKIQKKKPVRNVKAGRKSSK
jgi:hypothetical protein